MIKYIKKNYINLLLVFILGSVFLSIFFYIEEVLRNHPLTVISFLIPIIYGGFSSCLIYYYYQKNREKTLNIKENKYRKLFNNMKEGVAIYEPVDEGKNFKFLNINKAGLKIDDLKRENVIGKKVTEVFPGIKDFGLFEILQKVNKTGESEVYPITLYEDDRISGYRHNFLYKLPSGEIAAVYSDETELKQHERELKEKNRELKKKNQQLEQDSIILHNIKEMILVQDRNHKITWANKTAAEFFDITPEEMIGRDCYELVHNGESTITECPLDEVEKTGDVYNKEITEKNKVFNISGYPIQDDNEEIISLIEIIHDITERKNRERDLKRSYEILQAYSEEVTAINTELEDTLDKNNKLNNRLNHMINLSSSLQKYMNDENKFLSSLLRVAIEIVPEADYGKVWIKEKQSLKIVDTVGHDYSILKKVEIKADEIEKNLNFLEEKEGPVFKMESLSKKNRKYFEQGLKNISKSICVGIRVNSELIGMISLSIAENRGKKFDKITTRLLTSFSNLASTFFASQRYNKLQGKFTREVIKSVTNFLDIYDNYTSNHSKKVAELSADIAEKMGMSSSRVRKTYWSGMLHDMGKLLVPLNILNKTGSLSTREYEQIKKHPVWAYRALKDSSTLRDISRYVLYHHENWDGGGYPEGIEGENIPEVSRVLGLADAWDAMRSDRSYRKALSRTEALKEVKKYKGTQFAPEVVETFLEMEEKDILNK
ncbi:MAG: HD domain-containing phosphohydrolase [Bacillota bacterium]